jgi:DNA polymerase phi
MRTFSDFFDFGIVRFEVVSHAFLPSTRLARKRAHRDNKRPTQPGFKMESNGQPTVLEHFWNLASTDASHRIKAAHALITTLDAFQTAFQNEKDWKLATGDLEKLACADLAYSIKRLVRGLPSARQGARQGFATALSEILNRYPFIKTAWILDMLLEATPVGGATKGGEERDMYFGRLFGAQAIVESKCLTVAGQSTKEDVLRLASWLSEWSRVKPYLREPCFSVLVDMFTELKKAKKGLVTTEAVKAVLKEGLVDSPETVWFAAVAHHDFPELDWPIILPQWKYGNVLHPSNLSRTADALQHASTSHPRLHAVWNAILPRLSSKIEKSKDSTFTLQEFWYAVCEQRLFVSSHERRYLGFLLLQQILPQLQADHVPHVLTPNFIKTLVNNLSDSKNYLHKQALTTATSLTDAAANNSSLSVPLVTQLIAFNAQFDRVTKTRTVEDLLQKMTAENMQEYLDGLQRQFVNQPVDDEKRIEHRRQWCIDQMMGLVRNRKLPVSNASIIHVLKFIFVMGFVDGKGKSSVSELSHLPTPPLSEVTRNMCKARLFGMLADLTSRESMSQDGQFTQEIVDFAHQLSREADLGLTEDMKQATDGAMSTVKKIRKKVKKLSTTTPAPRVQIAQNRAFELLFSHMLLQLLVEPEDATTALQELEQCYTRAFEDVKASPTKRKKGAEEAEEALHPVEVLTDLLLSFLSKPSALLRTLSEQVFKVFCDGLTLKAAKLLLRALDPRCIGEEIEDGVDVDDMDEVEEDGLASGSGESGVSGDDSDEESDGDESDESDGETGGDIDASLTLKRQLKAAMGNQVLDSDDSDDESVLGDDDMDQFDDKLAEIFKQKKLANAVDRGTYIFECWSG